MKKTIKNKAGHKMITFGIHKSGKGQPFLKPELEGIWDSLHSIKYADGVYDSVSYYVPLITRFFFIGLIFSIEVHKRQLGAGKYVRYEDSHLAEIERAMNP